MVTHGILESNRMGADSEIMHSRSAKASEREKNGTDWWRDTTIPTCTKHRSCGFSSTPFMINIVLQTSTGIM